MKNLTAVILAAGVGKRFWPIQTHKLLLPFFENWSFVYSVGDVLPKQVSRVIVVVNDATKRVFDEFEFTVPHETVLQKGTRGMADALLSIEREVGDNPIQVLIADDFLDFTIFQNVIDRAETTNAFGVLPGWKTQEYFPGGYLVLEGDHIKNIQEKPGVGKEPSKYVYISGMYIANASTLMKTLKENNTSGDDIFEQALTSLMSNNTFLMELYEGDMVSLKYPWHILDILSYLFKHEFKPKRGNNVVIKENVVIEGDVMISDNVTIYENTKIVGPCYIGPNTIIGNNNIIRHSHIGANCVTGFNTDITRSYVGDNCWFHSNYVGDSVLEGNISMGSGSVLANLRLDEGEIGESGRTKIGAMIGCDVRIGVNASVMPGVKIGTNSMIGAGVVLEKDLENSSFALGKTELLIKKNTKKIKVRQYV